LRAGLAVTQAMSVRAHLRDPTGPKVYHRHDAVAISRAFAEAGRSGRCLNRRPCGNAPRRELPHVPEHFLRPRSARGAVATMSSAIQEAADQSTHLAAGRADLVVTLGPPTSGRSIFPRVSRGLVTRRGRILPAAIFCRARSQFSVTRARTGRISTTKLRLSRRRTRSERILAARRKPLATDVSSQSKAAAGQAPCTNVIMHPLRQLVRMKHSKRK